MSFFSEVDLAPPDLIFGIKEELDADTNPKKVSLLVGAYRTEEGKSTVLPIVRKVEKAMANDDTLGHEYLPIDGLQSFCSASSKLAVGTVYFIVLLLFYCHNIIKIKLNEQHL